MIKISLQRNDLKEISDLVSYTKDTITINGQLFTFSEGVDLLFKSPHDQIFDPKRDSKGILHATIIKQYTGKEKTVFETCDEHGHYCECKADNIPISKTKTIPIIVEIKKEEIKETTVVELIAQKNKELATLKEQYLDADLDDNEALKTELKAKVQDLKQEIVLLKENVENEK